MTSPAPPMAKRPRCTKCQSPTYPPSDEYWHIGDTPILLRSFTPRISRGSNSMTQLLVPRPAINPSTLARPAPAVAKYRKITAYSSASSPPFWIGASACGMCAIPYATSISSTNTSATGRVSSPITISSPPKNSSTPANPICENSSAVAPEPPIPPNQPKSFWAPCCMNNSPAAIRKITCVTGVNFASPESTPLAPVVAILDSFPSCPTTGLIVLTSGRPQPRPTPISGADRRARLLLPPRLHATHHIRQRLPFQRRLHRAPRRVRRLREHRLDVPPHGASRVRVSRGHGEELSALHRPVHVQQRDRRRRTRQQRPAARTQTRRRQTRPREEAQQPPDHRRVRVHARRQTLGGHRLASARREHGQHVDGHRESTADRHFRPGSV